MWPSCVGVGDSLSQPCLLTPHRGLAGPGQCSAPGQGCGSLLPVSGLPTTSAAGLAGAGWLRCSPGALNYMREASKPDCVTSGKLLCHSGPIA